MHMCGIGCAWAGPHLIHLTITAAFSTQRINIVLFFSDRQKSHFTAPSLYKGGACAFKRRADRQTKADSKNRQWGSGCLSSQWLQSYWRHTHTHTPITRNPSRDVYAGVPLSEHYYNQTGSMLLDPTTRTVNRCCDCSLWGFCNDSESAWV